MLDIKTLIESVQDYIARALRPLADRLSGLEQQIKSMPAPKDGVDGKDGSSVTVGDVLAALKEQVDDYLNSLPVPKDGADGVDGKDGENGSSVTIEDVLPALKAHIEDQIKAIPAPKNGTDGKDGQDGKDGTCVTIDDVLPGIREQVETHLKSLPVPKNGNDGKAGKDGASVSIDDILPAVEDQVASFLKGLPVPQDGRDGKDGQDGQSVTVEQVLQALNAHVAKAMAEHMLAFERRATDRIERMLTEIPKPKDGRDALELEDFDLTVGEDGRTVTMSLKRGDVLVEKTVRMATLLDRGVFKDGESYDAGDGVTWGGSYFIAQKDAPIGKPGEPGSDGWRLAVKRGRDGKNGRDGIDKTAAVTL
ncbi:hypothetical protein KVP10_08525 [Candidimonas humi]|uniref:Phage portal protein n=1 Tax=Candidimonas humi TaxID=683355 RepID=A0ABV8NXC4_9BURK|nr:hypothetical protein [Candidimonas humi]MBV6304931.1 hypothetical protein [Candidimonas humi]